MTSNVLFFPQNYRVIRMWEWRGLLKNINFLRMSGVYPEEGVGGENLTHRQNLFTFLGFKKILIFSIQKCKNP